MSQFDKISFANQIFWFIIFYFSSYYILIKYLLPRIFIIIKLREWKLNILLKEIKHYDNIINIWFNIKLNIYLTIIERMNSLVKNFNFRKNIYIEIVKKNVNKEFNTGKYTIEFLNRIKNILIRERWLNIKKKDV